MEQLTIQIDDASFTIGMVPQEVRQELGQLFVAGATHLESLKAVDSLLRCTVRSANNLKFKDTGKPLLLVHEHGFLSDQSILNLFDGLPKDVMHKLIYVCHGFTYEDGSEFFTGAAGEPLQGVEILDHQVLN